MAARKPGRSRHETRPPRAFRGRSYVPASAGTPASPYRRYSGSYTAIVMGIASANASRLRPSYLATSLSGETLAGASGLARGFNRKLMPMRLMAFMAAMVSVRSTRSFSVKAADAAA